MTGRIAGLMACQVCLPACVRRLPLAPSAPLPEAVLPRGGEMAEIIRGEARRGNAGHSAKDAQLASNL